MGAYQSVTAPNGCTDCGSSESCCEQNGGFTCVDCSFMLTENADGCGCKLTDWGIIVIVAMALLCLCGCIFGIVCCVRRRKRGQADFEASEREQEPINSEI